MEKLIGSLTVDSNNLTWTGDSTTTTTNWGWSYPSWTETQITTSFPIYVKPDLKVLNIKEKILFYYWDNQTLYYAIYEKGEKMEFKNTNDFLEVLNELGVFE